MSYLTLSGYFLLLFFSVLIINIPMLSAIDLAVVQWMFEHRNCILDAIAVSLSVLGGMPCVLFLTTVWCLALLRLKNYASIIFVGLGLIGSILLAWLIKYLVAKPRPPDVYHLVDSYGASFPSAHSVYASALACLIFYLTINHPKHLWIGITIAIWVIMMGISRIYLGVHFPSDVLSGWSISFIWIWGLYGLFCRYKLFVLMNNKF